MRMTTTTLRRSRTIVTTAVLLLGVTIAGAGCGRDADQGESSSSTFVVPIVADVTGPAGPLGQSWLAGVQAYLSRVNDDGGVGGRTIDFDAVYDSRGDGSAAPGAYQRALAQEPVAIMGYTLSDAFLASERVLDGGGVPVISSGLVDAWLAPDPKPWFFTAQVSSPEGTQVVLEKARTVLGGSLEGRKIAIASWDTPYFDNLVKTIAARAESEGFTVSEQIKTEAQTPSFAAQAKSILDSGAELVVSYVSPADQPALAKGLAAAGYRGPIVAGTAGNSDEVISSIGSGQFLTYREAKLPEAGDALTSAAGAVDAADAANSTWYSSGWAAAVLLTRGLEECGADCDGAALEQAIEGLGSVEVPDGATWGPLQVAADEHAVLSAVQFYTWDQKTESVVESGQPISLESQ